MTTDELILRRLLWLHHGHQGLYGDDGEMQCSECGGLDFKRHPVSLIEKRFDDIAFQKMANHFAEKNGLPKP